jgi:hypothetical protein
VLGAGIWIGEKRAEFSFQYADNYHKNFAGPSRGLFGDFPENNFVNGYGVFGSIIAIDSATLVISGQDDTEKIVRVFEDTIIRNSKGEISLDDLSIGDSVVIIGSPDEQGQVTAKLIRVLPPSSVFLYMKQEIL